MSAIDIEMRRQAHEYEESVYEPVAVCEVGEAFVRGWMACKKYLEEHADGK